VHNEYACCSHSHVCTPIIHVRRDLTEATLAGKFLMLDRADVRFVCVHGLMLMIFMCVACGCINSHPFHSLLCGKPLIPLYRSMVSEQLLRPDGCAPFPRSLFGAAQIDAYITSLLPFPQDLHCCCCAHGHLIWNGELLHREMRQTDGRSTGILELTLLLNSRNSACTIQECM
jgi:hypothetical protein